MGQTNAKTQQSEPSEIPSQCRGCKRDKVLRSYYNCSHLICTRCALKNKAKKCTNCKASSKYQPFELLDI